MNDNEKVNTFPQIRQDKGHLSELKIIFLVTFSIPTRDIINVKLPCLNKETLKTSPTVAETAVKLFFFLFLLESG